MNDVRDGKVTVNRRAGFTGWRSILLHSIDETGTKRLRNALRAKVDVTKPPLYTQ